MGKAGWLATGILTLAWFGALVSARAEEDSDEAIVNGRVGAELERSIEKAAPELWGSVLVARKGVHRKRQDLSQGHDLLLLPAGNLEGQTRAGDEQSTHPAG